MTDPAETIERAALTDVYEAAPPSVRRRLGIRTLEADGALACIAGGLPPTAIVLNRTIGLGLDQPATEQGVEQIVAAYRDADVARYFVHVHPDAVPAGISGWLESRGLAKARAWQKFRRGVKPPPAATTDLELREVGAEHGADFARIACAAFDLGEQAVDWLAQLPGRAGWRVAMAFDRGRPAATGALFIRDGFGWVDFGATAPEFRRRGAQSALLRHRVLLAIGAGCHTLYTGTGEAVAGDPQHSYANISKTGFELLERRDNYAPPKPA